MEAMGALHAEDPALLQPMGEYGLTLPGIISAVGFVGIGLAFLGAPQLLTRFISARDQKQIVEGGFIAVICVIGFDVKNELFGGGNPLGEWLRLGEQRYRVIGVMAPRGVSLGIDLDEVVHIPVSRSMEMFNRSGLFAIWAEVASLDQAEAGKKAAIALLKERHEGFEDVTITTQGSMMSASSRILAALTAALGGIAAITK